MKKLMSILLTVCMLISMTAVAGAETLDYTYADTIAWDGMYDVVVIGYGSAGANAAIAAADAGANVLMVEKAPKGHEGGNSRICGQYLLTFTDYDMGLNYMKGLRGAAALRRYCSMLEHFTDVDKLIDAVYKLQ